MMQFRKPDATVMFGSPVDNGTLAMTAPLRRALVVAMLLIAPALAGPAAGRNLHIAPPD